MPLALAEERAPVRLSAFRDCAEILVCPVTGEPLVAAKDGWISPSGGRLYPVEEGASPRAYHGVVVAERVVPIC